MWQTPTVCDLDPHTGTPNCLYRATWQFNDDTQDISFEIVTQTGGKDWTGIGFSEDRKMVKTDN